MSSATKLADRMQRNQIISEINKFIAKHPENKLHENKIRELVELYKSWRENYVRLTAFKFSRKVLYYLAKCMVSSCFRDSRYVVMLLTFIFEADKDFSQIIFEKILEPFEQHQCIRYFFDHCYQQKAHFRGNRIPLTKTRFYKGYELCLIDAAICQSIPTVLHQMLRYGAVLSYKKSCIYQEFRTFIKPWNLFPLYLAVCKIYYHNPDFLPLLDLELCPELKEEYIRAVNCCELLLRAYPQSSLKYCNIFNPDPNMQTEEDLHFVQKFSDNVIAGCKSHFIEPIKLKHACRCFIRQTLNEKWLLPSAIYSLPIPESLKMYVDLYYD